MKSFTKRTLPGAVAVALLAGAGAANANVYVQCGDDTNNNGIPPTDLYGNVLDAGDVDDPHIKCMHLTAGDGFMMGSDGHPMYTFGFADKTASPPDQVIADGILAARWPGSTIELDEGDEFYLSLTNVGTVMRPDLFDPHTVHFHGFPNAATVFDGVPEVSISINMGGTLTYYYNIVQPGTFIYHCHVEATEHMEMGMLANLYVHPRQDRLGIGGDVGPDGIIGTGDDVVDSTTAAPRFGGTGPTGYAYNDNDGTTAFDVEAPLQVSAFDSDFHDAHIMVQPLPFGALEGNYPQINGRGYPDTIKDPAVPNQDPGTLNMGPPVDDGFLGDAGAVLNNGEVSQEMGAAVSVTAGDQLLLRLSNVGIDRFYTLAIPGLTMKIVGTGAKLMRGVDGKNIYQETASVNFGGGETHDVLVDIPATAAAGTTYFLHTTELHQMGNKTQLDGGMITEIVVNQAL
jgi:FtsP/CotA-like multicopper oxidase with cupredoxin domain